jgi:hypothetical protein
MIRPVDLPVTVHAALSEQKLRWHLRGNAVGVVNQARVSRLGMATLAQQGSALRQHTGMIRAMWCVAQSTVFRNRLMLPQVRPALLSMTLKTRIVHGLPRELQCGGIPVRAVATTAPHLAFIKRMRKSFQRFASLQFVAVVADVRLGRSLQHSIAAAVTGMAAGARDVIRVVWPAMPAETNVRRVAFEAHTVLCGCRGRRVRTEFDERRRALFPAPNSGGVESARAMTGLALQLAVAERSTTVTRNGVLAAEQGKSLRIVVTAETGVGAIPAVWRVFLRVCRGGRQQATGNQAGQSAGEAIIPLHPVSRPSN